MYLDVLSDMKMKLQGLIEYCQQKHIPMGPDSYAQRVLWGSNETKGRGVDLEDMITSSNLILINRGQASTFKTVRLSSIDISVVNMSEKMHAKPMSGW